MSDAASDPAVPSFQIKIRGTTVGGLLAGLVLVGGVWLAGHLPLWHTDFWGHLRFGQLLLQEGFFSREPVSPFSDPAQAYVHYQWLAQAIYAALFAAGEAAAGGDTEQRWHGGVEAIRLLHALLCGSLLLLAYLAARARGATPGIAFLALVGTLVFSLSALLYHRPQLFGLVCFLAVLALVSRRTSAWWSLGAGVALFVLWANLHGSFVVGLFTLGVLAVGRALDVATDPQKGLHALFGDAAFRQLASMLLLATGAVALFNPHGPSLYLSILTFGRHPNLASLSEWRPLDFRWGGGGHLGWLLLVGIAVVTRLLARAPFTWGERLLLLAFFTFPFLQQRMQTWLVLILPWILARPWQLIRDRFNEQGMLLPTRRTGVSTAVVVVALVLVLLTQPAVWWLLRRSPSGTLGSAVSAPTPWQLGLRWRDEPPGTIFASETVGDFLFWALPAGSRVMMTTHAHLFPPEHWNACLQVKYVEPGWEAILEDYQVKVVLVDAADHPGLVAALSRDPNWRVAREIRLPARLFLAERR